MTTQEIIDELNAGRARGISNWYVINDSIFAFVGNGDDEVIRWTSDRARREAEAIRRKRREIDLEPIMPLLEAIVSKANHFGDPDGDLVDVHHCGDNPSTTTGDVRKVVEAWKARRA